MTRIAGNLDYATLARWNRPADPALLARDMARRGLTHRDIAQALNPALAAVADLPPQRAQSGGAKR